jgi:aryl-alcohol dehydrogenase-like predicted oxidoreductase
VAAGRGSEASRAAGQATSAAPPPTVSVTKAATDRAAATAPGTSSRDRQRRQCAPTSEAGSAQLALAWVLSRAPFIIAIPGTKRRKYLEDNAGAVSVVISPEDDAHLEAVMPKGAVVSARYAPAGM